MKKKNLSIFRSSTLKKISTFLSKYKKIIFLILILGIFYDSFFILVSYDLITFGILIFYGILVKLLNVKSKSTFLLCLLLLVVMFGSYLYSGTSIATEKAAVWLFLFMAMGVFQEWMNVNRK